MHRHVPSSTSSIAQRHFNCQAFHFTDRSILFIKIKCFVCALSPSPIFHLRNVPLICTCIVSVLFKTQCHGSILWKFIISHMCVEWHMLSTCDVCMCRSFSSNYISAPWPRPQQQWLTTGARYAGRRNSQGRRRATSLRIELREQLNVEVLQCRGTTPRMLWQQ